MRTANGALDCLERYNEPTESATKMVNHKRMSLLGGAECVKLWIRRQY